MLEYVKEMREIIGHKTLILCGASTIIFNKKKQVLMLKRTDNNCWCFPGGAVEIGEEVEEAAIREVKEESGLDINIKDLILFHVFSGKGSKYVYPNGDKVFIIDIVYIASKYTNEISVNEESKEYCFFNLNEIPKNISPPVVQVVNRLLETHKELNI